MGFVFIFKILVKFYWGWCGYEVVFVSHHLQKISSYAYGMMPTSPRAETFFFFFFTIKVLN